MRLRDKIRKVNLGKADAAPPVRAQREVLAEDHTKPADSAGRTQAGQQSKDAERGGPAFDSTDVVLEFLVDNLGVGVLLLPCHYLVTSIGLDGGMRVSVENKDAGVSQPASWKEQGICPGEAKLFELGPAGGDLLVAYEGKAGTDLAFTITLGGVRGRLLKESRILDYWARCIGEPTGTGTVLVSVSEGRHPQKASAMTAGPMEQWVGFSRIGSPAISSSALSAAFADRGLELANSLSLGSDSIKAAARPGEQMPELGSIELLLAQLKEKLAQVREKSAQ